MTFAPPRNQPIGKIAEVLAQNIVHAADLKNDGDHKYMTTEIPVSDPPLPTSSASQYIYVPLTTSQVDVVEFQKSFFKMRVSFTISANGYLVNNADDDEPCGKIFGTFIGLKHSTDIIGDYQIRYKGKPIAVQPNATTESFLYQSLRDDSQIQYRPGNHSPSENASGLNQLVCGSIFTLQQIQATYAATVAADKKGKLNVEFTVLIPFTDIQIFQQFDDYPNALFGDLEIGIKINPQALVSMQQDPMKNLQYRLKTHQTGNYSTIKNVSFYTNKKFTREFVQVGDSFTGVIHAKVGENAAAGSVVMETVECSFKVESFKIEACSSIISGYNVESGALERMRKTYAEQPWVVFTQTIDVKSFNHKPAPTGIDTSQQVRYNNTSDIILLFPTTENEQNGTVFKNPMLQNLSVYTMGNSYPQMPLSTYSATCIQLMLNSCINKTLTPQKDFATSLTQPRWNNDATYTCGADDATTFLLDLKVERSSALGLMNDGLDSGGVNESIRLIARPIYPNSAADTYCNRTALATPLPAAPAPMICLIGDAYWAFNSKNGGNCMISSQPFEKQIPTFMAN